MRGYRSRFLLLMSLLVFLNVCLLNYIEEKVRQINCFPYELAKTHFIEQAMDAETTEYFYQAAEQDLEVYCELLTMYYASDYTCTDIERLKADIAFVKEYQPEKFDLIKEELLKIYQCAEVFPVGAVENLPDAAVHFTDSWNQARSYGGNRAHEGCDIMATFNQRGAYPVYSVSEGVIENIGWLPLGGYRIFIKNKQGAYFYYAHLYEYAKEFAIGEEVAAGTLLGFMGDSGYGEEGTVGQFDVHLHFGIYMKDENGAEYSVNSYPFLCYLWNHGENELWQSD